MATNKLTTVVDNIEAALAALVDSGTLKQVVRGIINPLEHKNVPAVAIAVSRLRRRDATWLCDLLIAGVTQRSSKTDPDEAVADLVAELDYAITAMVSAGTAGAYIAEPTWDCWYMPGSESFPLRPVGAIGQTTIRIDGDLKST